jgi:hypothetical protein
MNPLYYFTESLLNEATSFWLPTLDKYYQKLNGKKYVLPSQSEEDMMQEIIDVAAKLGFEGKSNDTKTNAQSANQYILNHLEDVKKEPPEEEKEDEKDDKDEKPNHQEPTQAEDIQPKKWPKYEEFRKKYYIQTVQAGWPSSITYPDVNDNKKESGVELPWSKFDKSAFVFNKRGKGLVSLRNYTQKIKTYLFTKFEKNVDGLKKLQSLVIKILAVEEQFLHKKPVGSFLSTALLGVFRGLGANQSDEALFKWLGSKFTGMTIFEYQKSILDEMVIKLEISDNTSLDLKNVIYPIHALAKKYCSQFFDISIVKVAKEEYENAYTAKFTISNKTGTKDPKYNKTYSAFSFVLENITLPIIKKDKEFVKSKSGKFFESNVSEEDVKNIINSLNKISEKGNKDTDKNVGDVVKKRDIILFRDAIDEESKKNVGTYQLEFSYVVKGCIITVAFLPKEG